MIFPLCLYGKCILSLASTSGIGMMGIVYLAIVMLVRWLDGSYQEGGTYSSSDSFDSSTDCGEGVATEVSFSLFV